MAASKNFGAKAEFIRSMPADMSANQIIAEAKKRGLKITSSHIYNLRAKTSDKPSAGRTSARATRGARTRSSGVEAALRKAIAEIGLARAREVFADVEARFGSGS